MESAHARFYGRHGYRLVVMRERDESGDLRRGNHDMVSAAAQGHKATFAVLGNEIRFAWVIDKRYRGQVSLSEWSSSVRPSTAASSLLMVTANMSVLVWMRSTVVWVRWETSAVWSGAGMALRMDAIRPDFAHASRTHPSLAHRST